MSKQGPQTSPHTLLATYYRTALLLGLVREEDVHRWAAQVIGQEREPPRAFVEIVSVAADDLSGMRHALWPLVIDPEPLAVLEAILGVLYADLVADRRKFDDTLTILRLMRSLLRLPSGLYADMNAALVTYATSQQRKVVVEWLQRFAHSRVDQLER